MTTYYPAQIEQGITGQAAEIIQEPTQDDIVMNGQGAAIEAATVTINAGNAGDVWPTFGTFSANDDTGTGWTPASVAATTWNEN